MIGKGVGHCANRLVILQVDFRVGRLRPRHAVFPGTHQRMLQHRELVGLLPDIIE